MSWLERNRARRLLATIGSCSFAILMTAGVVWASEGGTSMWPDFWQRVKTLDQVIDVDYYLPGCPPPPDLVASAVTAVTSLRACRAPRNWMFP